MVDSEYVKPDGNPVILPASPTTDHLDGGLAKSLEGEDVDDGLDLVVIQMMQMKLMMMQIMRSDHSVEQWEEEGVVQPFGRFWGFEGGTGEDNTEREYVDEKQAGDANHLYCRRLQYNPVEIDSCQTSKMFFKRTWINPQILGIFGVKIHKCVLWASALKKGRGIKSLFSTICNMFTFAYLLLNFVGVAMKW